MNWLLKWLPWILLAEAGLHMFEEFVFPGGFATWYRRYRPNASRVTAPFLFWINAALILGCANVGLLGDTPLGVAYWLVMSALLCANGIWHVWATLRSSSYSPGVVTGIVLYIPTAMLGYVYMLRSGRASMMTAIVALALGTSYPLWSAIYHRDGRR